MENEKYNEIINSLIIKKKFSALGDVEKKIVLSVFSVEEYNYLHYITTNAQENYKKMQDDFIKDKHILSSLKNEMTKSKREKQLSKIISQLTILFSAKIQIYKLAIPFIIIMLLPYFVFNYNNGNPPIISIQKDTVYIQNTIVKEIPVQNEDPKPIFAPTKENIMKSNSQTTKYIIAENINTTNALNLMKNVQTRGNSFSDDSNSYRFLVSAF